MKLFYRELGAGSPLIILHGLFGMSDNWFTMAKRLAENFHVFLPDLRNHGHSPQSPDFNYKQISGDVQEFIRDHQLNHCRIIGHSMGGKAAMTLALAQPQLISGLVVIDMAPRAYQNPFFNELIKILQALDIAALKSRPQADDMLASAIEDAAARQFLLKNLARRQEGGYYWKFNLPSIAANIREIMGGIESPTQFTNPALFIAGGRSDYVAPHDLPRIRELFPAARLVTISKASHWVHADAPDALFDELYKFLVNDK
jgi:pimeloyl-ACP methyl ester carboxylesterase